MFQSATFDFLGQIQGQTEWDSERPDLAVGVPGHRKGVAFDDLYGSLPTPKILWF